MGTDEPDSLLWTRLDNLDFKLLNMDECAAKNARKAGAPLTMMTMLCSLMLQGLHEKVPLLVLSLRRRDLTPGNFILSLTL